MLHKVTSALVVLCLLTSCGGGGGSSSSSSGGGSGVRFTPDRSSVEFAYDEGMSFMPTTNITVTATGTFTGTLYIGAVVEGTGIDPNIPASITGQTAIFALQARSGLAAGTYTGRVQLLGCRDAACTNQIGNSPVIVNYTLTVRVTLAATPGTVTATAQSGSATTSNVTVRLPTGANSFSTVITSGEEWMSIDQVTAAGFRVNLRSLPQGSFGGSIRVSAGASQVNIPVNYTVAGGVPYVTLNVQPNNLTLTGNEGAVSTPVNIAVTPPSWDPVTSLRLVQPQSNDPVPWLSSAPVNGGYALTVDATNLAAGTYSARAFISGAYPSTERQVPIALTVGYGLVLPADQLKVITAESTPANLIGTSPVNVVSGPPVNWTAQSFAPWLILTDDAGVTGETLAFRIDASQLDALPNDGTEQWGGITITPQRASMSPRTFAVRVSKRLAAITHVGPYLQPTGRNTRLILRGHGFDAIDNLTARLQFAGGTVSQVTRVNDTELVVHTGPLNLGTFPFSISNAMNVPTATASVKTYTPQNFAAVALPTGGDLRGLFYDAERSSVYLVNGNLESLQRYRFTNQWNLASLPMPAMVGAGLSQDGSRLLVATSTPALSRIRQLDPADLNVQISSTDLTQTLSSSWANTITSTNDGRAWFAVGTGWNNMAYFNPVTSEMTVVMPPISTSFYGGPGFAMSRDGERLMILQTGSNAQQMLYMDAADSEVRVNPANLQNNYRMSLSDDAGRYLYDNYEVRDRDFALIGRLPGQLPRAMGDIQHWVFSSVLSPDGSRVYAVALPVDFPYQTTPARLYVFDSTTRQQASDELPLLGYMSIAGYPSCAPLAPNTSCSYGAHITVSPDGNTVFVAGNSNLVVVPVGNPILTPVMKARPSAVQKVGRGVTVPWHLNL